MNSPPLPSYKGFMEMRMDARDREIAMLRAEARLHPWRVAAAQRPLLKKLAELILKGSPGVR